MYKASFYATVTSRLRKFRRGRGTEDEHHSGLRSTQSPGENVQKVHQIVLVNLKIANESMVQEFSLSMDIVHTVNVYGVGFMGTENVATKMKNVWAMISTALLIRYIHRPKSPPFMYGYRRWGLGSLHGKHAVYSRSKNVQGHTHRHETYGNCILRQWGGDECGLLAFRYGNEWAMICWFAFDAARIHQRWAQGQSWDVSPPASKKHSRTHQPSCNVNWYHTQGIFCMMTSSIGNIFRVTGPLCGEFIGHRWIPS